MITFIFFVIMSICLTFESWQNNPGTEFRGVVSKLENKIPIRACVFTFSVKLEKCSFRVADLPRMGKEIYRNKKKKAREGRAKLLFFIINYAKFVTLSLPSGRIS